MPTTSDQDGDAKRIKATTAISATKAEAEAKSDKEAPRKASCLEDQIKTLLTANPPYIAEAEYLAQEQTALDFLEEDDCWINNESIPLLLMALKDNTILDDLHLGYITVTEQGANALAALLTQCKALKSFEFYHNSSLGVAGTKTLLTALQTRHDFDAMCFGGLVLDVENAQLLSQIIGTHTQLESLGLRFCQFHDGALAILMEAVNIHPTLQTLSLAANNLTDITAVASILPTSLRLKKLDLNYNQLTDSMIEILAAALSKNKSVITLELRGNPFQGEGANFIAEALRQQKNHSLQEIILPEHIGSKPRSKIAARLEMNNLGVPTAWLKDDQQAATVYESKSVAIKFYPARREKLAAVKSLPLSSQITQSICAFYTKPKIVRTPDSSLSEQKATSSSNSPSSSEASPRLTKMSNRFLEERRRQRKERSGKTTYRQRPKGQRPQDKERDKQDRIAVLANKNPLTC